MCLLMFSAGFLKRRKKRAFENCIAICSVWRSNVQGTMTTRSSLVIDRVEYYHQFDYYTCMDDLKNKYSWINPPTADKLKSRHKRCSQTIFQTIRNVWNNTCQSHSVFQSRPSLVGCLESKDDVEMSTTVYRFAVLRQIYVHFVQQPWIRVALWFVVFKWIK